MRRLADIKYLRPTDVSQLTGLSLSTLARWRSTGEGIPYSKIGGSILYQIDDVSAFMESHRVSVSA